MKADSFETDFDLDTNKFYKHIVILIMHCFINDQIQKEAEVRFTLRSHKMADQSCYKYLIVSRNIPQTTYVHIF